MVWRPFYFANLIVDPKNADRLFKTDGALIMSEDAGKSFATVGGFNGAHGDVHDVWIDPANPQNVIAARRWRDLVFLQWRQQMVERKQPADLAVLSRERGRRGSVSGLRRFAGQRLLGRRIAIPGGIDNSQWQSFYFGDGFWMFPDPADPDYLYAEAQGGNIGRVNRKTREGRDIQPKPNYKEKLRFNWNTPHRAFA